ILRGQIEVALRRPRDADQYRQTLHTLAAQVRELQEIVDVLLFIARASADAPPLELQEMSVARWWSEYASRWENHPRHADLVSNVDTRASIRASHALLAQAFDNLISNALKYSRPASPVQIEIAAAGHWVDLSVSDRGIGVDPGESEA